MEHHIKYTKILTLVCCSKQDVPAIDWVNTFFVPIKTFLNILYRKEKEFERDKMCNVFVQFFDILTSHAFVIGYWILRNGHRTWSLHSSLHLSACKLL